MDPGRVPGGWWFRVTAGGRVWDEHGLGSADDGAEVDRAVADAGRALELAERYGEARVYVYDGDTGECVHTIVVER
jgi:hypothetical protein